MPAEYKEDDDDDDDDDDQLGEDSCCDNSELDKASKDIFTHWDSVCVLQPFESKIC